MAVSDEPAALPLMVVDAANVVGSVPDGWWRDRFGSAERLRDALVEVAARGLPGDRRGTVPAWARRPPFELVLVVEGAARGLGSAHGVRVVSAPGSGDDAIVDLLRERGADRPCLVITADRELRGRVTGLGASVVGPRVVWPPPPERAEIP
ncbi:NTP pyrophosphohydrolase [Gandjariella thermophila]|uniref:NTP pyrophosphohydrolase n=1 Tax=Gandjariella thermophila TaxID=1931992 RepID=A0A4D4IZK0_9PSEU|nr:NTP pyrophosphohydrolase [Gandjariella thermophila]GDY29681.1 hypothetical protein GTS_13140 [Gandjariella thermophila]